jgi:hypothetical protein
MLPVEQAPFEYMMEVLAHLPECKIEEDYQLFIPSIWLNYSVRAKLTYFVC